GRLVTAFAGSDGCADCHEFAFPRGMGGPHLMMQATIREHTASPYAGDSCASCHMPWVDGPSEGRHRSHRFAASRDQQMVRSAVVIEATWELPKLTLRLTPGAVGHAFPTGDMLRRVAVVIEVRDAEGRTLDRHERYLTRHFGFERRPNEPLRRVERHDDRVGVDGRAVTISFLVKAPPRGGSVAYRV